MAISRDAQTPADAVGHRLRELRSARDMTQEDLAAACAEAGAPAYTAMVIHRLENGSRHVKVNDVYALASVFGVSPLVLLMPSTGDTTLMLTTTRSAKAVDVYEWTVGRRPAPSAGEVNDTARASAWVRLRKYLPYASRTSGTLRLEINEDNIAEILREEGKRDN